MKMEEKNEREYYCVYASKMSERDKVRVAIEQVKKRMGIMCVYKLTCSPESEINFRRLVKISKIVMFRTEK